MDTKDQDLSIFVYCFLRIEVVSMEGAPWRSFNFCLLFRQAELRAPVRGAHAFNFCLLFRIFLALQRSSLSIITFNFCLLFRFPATMSHILLFSSSVELSIFVYCFLFIARLLAYYRLTSAFNFCLLFLLTSTELVDADIAYTFQFLFIVSRRYVSRTWPAVTTLSIFVYCFEVVDGVIHPVL